MLTLRQLRFYQQADALSGWLIAFMVVFSPWAFGTTQPWSIWTMNSCGYLLGALLAAKLFIRFRRGYRPARWDDPSAFGRAGTPLPAEPSTLGGASVPASRSVPENSARGTRNSELGTESSSVPLSASDGERAGERCSPSLLLPPSSLAREVASPTSPGRPSTFDLRHSSFKASSSTTPNSLLTTLSSPFPLALLTALILAYCLISALNARATYDWSAGSLIYRDCLRWLPHSYDAPSTWRAFWNYLALAAFFWSLRDWLLGRTATEARNFQLGTRNSELRTESSSVPLSASAGERAGERCSSSLLPPPSSLAREVASPTSPGRPSSFVIRHSSFSLPSRLRWLLWLLSLNGALLAVEGIAQRLSGTNKLLWFMPTRLNREALSQFGPYAYRSNGAQYLNLIWPVALGFWWHLRHEARRRRTATARRSAWLHHLLLPCILVTAAAPIISTSRAGAIVAIILVLLAGGLLMFAMRRRHPLTRFFTVLFLGAIFAVGAYVVGDQLFERMREFGPGLELREQIYQSAQSMAVESPLFGLGPGTFATMFQFYLPALGDNWLAQLHNDWLETRITFGWVGCALIALAFLANQARAFLPGGLAIRWPLAAFIWLALAGCLLHARWDFPFQIYSILCLFVILCAVLSSFSVRPTTAS